MEDIKRRYHIDPGSKEVLPEGQVSEGHFTIEATDQEIAFIRELFEEDYSAELETYVRSHIPYLDYSHDPENDHYDRVLIAIYALIHKLGDEKSRRHVEEMGILDKNRLNEKKDF